MSRTLTIVATVTIPLPSGAELLPGEGCLLRLSSGSVVSWGVAAYWDVPRSGQDACLTAREMRAVGLSNNGDLLLAARVSPVSTGGV